MPTPTPQLIDQLDPMINGWPTSQPNPLAGTYWNLLSLKGHPLIPGTRIILSFSDTNLNGGVGDTIYGNASCNDYNGPVYISGHQFRLGITQIYLVGCQQNLSEQENIYFKTLTDLPQQIADYQITSDGDRTMLIIMDANNQPALMYVKISLDLYQNLSTTRILPTPLSTETSVLTSTPLFTISPIASTSTVLASSTMTSTAVPR
jgi:heat shock protein HslJ